MKSFRNFLNEEVLPSVQVADGGLDIEKPAVRAAINAAIAGVVSQPAVTPYVVYNRLSKLLAQYHIVLPKRFLEGDKGVEVFEVRQFGHKMGMTDGGEFVNHVPSTHYLFLQYGILSPMGITYAKPVVGGMFKVTARLVDKAELDKLLDMAEVTMSEEAEVRQMAAKAMAPKEPMHDITSDEKKKGNKEAVATSEKDLNEVSLGKLVRYKNKAGEGREKGLALADKKMKGKAKVNASMPKNAYMEEDKDPCWKGYEMVGMKKKGGKPVPNCVPVKEEQIDELSKKALGSYVKRASVDLYGKGAARGFEVSKGQMDSPAKKKAGNRIAGIYRASDKLAKEETQIDELKKTTLASYIKKASHDVATRSAETRGAAMKSDEARKNLDYMGAKKHERFSDKMFNKSWKRRQGIAKAADKLAKEETQIDEKAPPGAKFERMVKHIKKGYEKDGLTAKEKSIAYATAWKAKNREKGE